MKAKLVSPYSLAYYCFKKNMTFINNQYWGSIPQGLIISRFVASKSPDMHIKEALAITSSEADHYPTTVNDLSNRSKELLHWIRLNTILGLSSSVEMYLASIFKVSFLCNPALLLGVPSSINGFECLKHENNNLEKTVDSCVQSMVKGTWSSRKESIVKYFQNLRDIFNDDMIKNLEFIRKTRNGVGHALGGDLESIDCVNVYRSVELQPISRERLEKCMRLMAVLINSIEKTILTDDVKKIELLLYIKNTNPINDIRRASSDADTFYLDKIIKRINVVFGNRFMKPKQLRSLLRYLV